MLFAILYAVVESSSCEVDRSVRISKGWVRLGTGSDFEEGRRTMEAEEE